MIDQIIELCKVCNQTPELWVELAKIYKNMFDALVQVGFDKDQALKVICEQGAGINNIK